MSTPDDRDAQARPGGLRRRRRGGPTHRRRIDEVLEQVWMAREARAPYTRDKLQQDFRWPDVVALARSMVHDGLLNESGDAFTFTEAGEQQARTLIRCHRLAECLFRDVLELPESRYETNACVMEHALSPEVADSICTLLGHPAACPHGCPIPRGPCCKEAKRELRPVVVPLPELEVGGRGRIAYIATRHHARLDRLATLGVLPGTVLRLHQRRPAVIIQLDETQLALDDAVASDIFVRRLP